ncbi:MAG: M15 family metallopeptidase [Oscillospiraceae bacterium]
MLWFVISLFSKIFSGDKSDDSSLSSAESSLSSSEASSQTEPNTVNTNYDYVEYQNGLIFEGELILVNNNTMYSIDEPDDVVSVYENKNKSYYVKDMLVSLKPDVITALNSMATDFVSATGENNLMVISGFRSVEKQQEIYDADLADNNATTSTLVAMAGYSEHHTGYAVDFGIYPADGVYKSYDGTGNFAWINNNCYKYGFIVRYKEEKAAITGINDETWHFRYVGKPHAFIMQQNNLCFEEYIDYIKQYSFDGIKENCKVTTDDGGQYEIYYVPVGQTSTEIPVPKNYSYTVSGNNVDGFIVTVKIL